MERHVNTVFSNDISSVLSVFIHYWKEKPLWLEGKWQNYCSVCYFSNKPKVYWKTLNSTQAATQEKGLIKTKKATVDLNSASSLDLLVSSLAILGLTGVN